MTQLANVSRLTSLTIEAFANSIQTEAGGIKFLINHSSRSNVQRITEIKAALALIESDLGDLANLVESL